MLPALLVAAAVAVAGKGVKDGLDAKEMQERAERLKDRAERRYNAAKAEVEECTRETEERLVTLGELQISIGQSFKEFRQLSDDLLEKINKSGVMDGKSVELPLNKYDLQAIEGVELSAQEFLGMAAGGAVASAAAGFAVYGGVMTLGAASTGTAIATLSGAAATNATLAAIGGGSLAAGGLGIAGGTAILGGVIAAPIIAIGGGLYKSKMKEGLEAAKKYDDEVDDIIRKYARIQETHEKIQDYVQKVYKELRRLNRKFVPFIEKLKEVSQWSLEDLASKSDEIVRDIGNGRVYAEILAHIIQTPLFEMKGEKNMETGAWELVPRTDSNGCFVINDDEMKETLAKQAKKEQEIDVA